LRPGRCLGPVLRCYRSHDPHRGGSEPPTRRLAIGSKRRRWKPGSGPRLPGLSGRRPAPATAETRRPSCRRCGDRADRPVANRRSAPPRDVSGAGRVRVRRRPADPELHSPSLPSGPSTPAAPGEPRAWTARELRPADPDGARLGGFDLEDLELERAAWSDHLDDLTLLLAENRLADGRLVRDPILC